MYFTPAWLLSLSWESLDWYLDQVGSTAWLIQAPPCSPPLSSIEDLHVVQELVLAPPVGTQPPGHGQLALYGGHGVRSPAPGETRKIDPLKLTRQESFNFPEQKYDDMKTIGYLQSYQPLKTIYHFCNTDRLSFYNYCERETLLVFLSQNSTVSVLLFPPDTTTPGRPLRETAVQACCRLAWSQTGPLSLVELLHYCALIGRDRTAGLASDLGSLSPLTQLREERRRLMGDQANVRLPASKYCQHSHTLLYTIFQNTYYDT